LKTNSLPSFQEVSKIKGGEKIKESVFLEKEREGQVLYYERARSGEKRRGL